MSSPDDADKWEAPEGHEKISDHTLGFLTVKEGGELHWKGDQVVVNRPGIAGGPNS